MGDRSVGGIQCEWAYSVQLGICKVGHLFQQSTFLDHVRNSLLLDAASLFDILEGIEFLCLFMFDDTDLWKMKEIKGVH
jgi:hypothetical protein